MGDKDRFAEDLLEASLREHHRAEPRAGLEARILAGVAARERAGRRRWLWMFAAAAAAVVLVVTGVRGLRHRPTPVPVASQAAAPQPPPATFAFSPPKTAAPRVQRKSLRRIAARPSQPAHFPTPRPLTQQEKLLLVYTQVVPKKVLATPITPPPTQNLDIPDVNIAALDIKPLPGSAPDAAD